MTTKGVFVTTAGFTRSTSGAFGVPPRTERMGPMKRSKFSEVTGYLLPPKTQHT